MSDMPTTKFAALAFMTIATAGTFRTDQERLDLLRKIMGRLSPDAADELVQAIVGETERFAQSGTWN